MFIGEGPNEARGGEVLFLSLFEDDSLAELFGVFFELDFAFYFALILARPIHLASLFVL